jgi:hypothetical protein
MRKITWVVGLAACVLAGGVGCGKKTEEQAAPEKGGERSAQVGDLSGKYTIQSATNPGGGGGYKGTVNITKTGDVYKLAWAIPNSPPYSGVALTEGSTLAVGWGMGARYGVVVYRINGGKLSGKWATAGSGPTPGTEELVGPDGLNGVYTITSGKGPDGKSYSGTVSITPSGSTYAVRWALANETYSGVGIREGDTLIVGWGEAGQGAGAVSYQVSGSSLVGKWATPGGTALGTETIARN